MLCIVLAFGLPIIILLHRMERAENKLKDLNQSIQFAIITSPGVDPKGLEMWEKMKNDGKLECLFTWETSAEMAKKLRNAE